MWYRYNDVNDVNNGAFRGYAYIYADDVILHERVPKRGIVAKDENRFAVEVKGAPAITQATVRKVDASRAPTRTWVKDGGVRTLLASYDISVRNPDRSAWQPLAERVEVFLTLPEVPEMGLVPTAYCTAALSLPSPLMITFTASASCCFWM